MKAKRIALAILLSVLMVVSAVLVVACKPDDPKKDDKNVKIDLLNAADWDGFNDETNYTISNNTDGSLQVDYEKSDTYQLFTRTMVDPIDDLAKIKKLVAKVKMTSDQATPELMFKFEGSDAPATAEVTIQVGGDYATYEWTLGQYTTSKPYDLSKASALRVFADPGDATAKGSITFSEFYLSSEDPVAANTIKLPEPSKPADHVWKEITADDTSVVDWEDGGMGVYTITKDASSVKAVVDKDSVEGDTAWTAMISYIYGDALATMKSFRIDIKGTAGTTALIKPLDYHDFDVTFDGTVQHFEFDISAQASRADADFSQKDASTSDNRVAIIALNGAKSGTAELEISLAEFSTEEAKNDTPTPTLEVNEITATNKTVNKAWYDGGDSVYDVEKQSDGSFKVSFDKNGFEYPTVKALVKGSAIADMTTIKFTIRGTNGTKLILKPFDQQKPIETDAVLTGGDDEFTIDISSYVAGKTFDVEEPIVIMAEGGNKTATGEFTIVNVEFGTDAVTPQPDPNLNEITTSNHSVTKWHPLDAGTYTATAGADGKVNVTYDKNQWQFLLGTVKGAELANLGLLKVVIKGTAGEEFSVKFLEIETKHVLTAEETEFVVDYTSKIASTNFNTNNDIVLCANRAEGHTTGSFEIISAEFEEGTPTVDPDLNVITADNTKITKGWKPMDAGTYTVTANGDGFKVQFNKTGQYQFLRTYVKGSKIMDFDTIRFTVKGEAGKEILFKFLGKELRFDLTGANDVFDLGYAEKLANQNLEQNLEVLICANSKDNQPLTGEFDLISAEFVETYNEITAQNHKVTGGWRPLDKDKDYYTVTKQASGAGFDIAYKKVGQYNFLFTNVLGSELANMNKVVFKVKGTAGKEILLKFVGKEDRFNLTGGEDTFTLDFSANKSGKDFTQIQQLLVVIDSATNGAAEGTFSILDVEFTA